MWYMSAPRGVLYAIRYHEIMGDQQDDDAEHSMWWCLYDVVWQMVIPLMPHDWQSMMAPESLKLR